jgi:hypothetical protein
VVGVDVEKYSPRNVREQEETQRGLVRVLNEAAQAAGLDREDWEKAPGGDGELAVLPADANMVRVVGEFISQLDQRLAVYNESRSPSMRIRLRVAAHIGMTVPSAMGHAGPALVELSRLLDAKELMRALEKAKGARMALLVSEVVYQWVVKSGYASLWPEQFRRLTVRNPGKRFRMGAYLYVPPVPRLPPSRRRPKVPVIALATACAVVVALAALLGVREFADGNSSTSLQMTKQEQYLAERVSAAGSFTGCSPAARQVPDAEAAINCKTLNSYISVSASSFNGESSGLSVFLKTIIPANMLNQLDQSSHECGYGSAESCLYLGFYGYKESLKDGTIYGSLYCYEQSGKYFIVWTYENDEYESEHDEDFAVVASVASNAPIPTPLDYLIRWWDSGPV